MNNSIIKVSLATLLLLCLIDMPFGFYQFVRFAAMVGFSYLEYVAKEQNEVFIYIALAILFQPFFKLALGRNVWNIVDVIVGIGLVIKVIKDSKIK
jgi:hypothetical protein